MEHAGNMAWNKFAPIGLPTSSARWTANFTQPCFEAPGCSYPAAYPESHEHSNVDTGEREFGSCNFAGQGRRANGHPLHSSS